MERKVKVGLAAVVIALCMGTFAVAQGAQEGQGAQEVKEPQESVSRVAEDTDHMSTDESRKRELVIASHLLVDQGVLDSFGHISVRSATDPNVFFIPKAMPPAEVRYEDIVEIDVQTGEKINPDAPRPNGERYIHAGIYKTRPDVNCVIHSHTMDVIPFTLAQVPLKPVLAQSGFLPLEVPVFEIRDAWGPDAEKRGVQIKNLEHAVYAAEVMGDSPILLLRGHGMNAAGDTIHRAVVRAIYTKINANVQLQAELLSRDGNIVAIDQKEHDFNVIENFDVERPWDNFVRIMEENQAK